MTLFKQGDIVYALGKDVLGLAKNDSGFSVVSFIVDVISDCGDLLLVRREYMGRPSGRQQIIDATRFSLSKEEVEKKLSRLTFSVNDLVMAKFGYSGFKMSIVKSTAKTTMHVVDPESGRSDTIYFKEAIKIAKGESPEIKSSKKKKLGV